MERFAKIVNGLRFLIISGAQEINELQKQPFRGVLRKRCSEKMQKIYRTPMPKCDFNKVALQVY